MANGVTNKDLYEAIQNVRDDMGKNFVRKEAFQPIQKTVYGMVGAIMLTVLGALVALVVRV